MKKVIKKVLDELAKPTPDLSYMRGLLEGLVEDEENPTFYASKMSYAVPPKIGDVFPIPTEYAVDEASSLDALAKANLEKVKMLSELSNE